MSIKEVARVQGDASKPTGWIDWEEHLEAWLVYARDFGSSQTAQHISERGGFGYSELVVLLGHEPTTWTPVSLVR